jgi:DNA-binding Lrp family transcriptional regulator
MATSENIESQLFIKNLTGKTKFVISKNSRALGISRQTHQNKLDNLRKEKIINSFTININPNIHPVGLKYVMIKIKTNPKEPELVDELLKIPQLRMLDGIIGDFSLFGLFIFKSSQEYHQILNIIDKIMAGSYFKKYQIIETIKIFKTNGISLRNSKINFGIGKKINQTYNIDELDYLILKILQDDQGIRPISTYEIKDLLSKKYAESLKSLNKDDISQSTIHNRIKRLELQGIILNYTTNFSPKKIGFEGKYFLRIKPKDPSKYNELAFNLVKNKDITDLFRIGEQHGLFAIVRVKKVEDYADFIRELYQSDEIEDTLTIFVLDELKTYSNFVIY